MAYYIKEIPKFNAENFDNWKNKMRTHLIYMGIHHWMIKKNEKKLVEESNLASALDDDKKLFHCNMVTKEELINALSKEKFTEVKELDLANKIWKRLEALYEGDQYTKSTKLKNWKAKMEKLKMQDNENIRAYV